MVCPTGVYHEWKANATGRSAKTVREFLEKNYSTEIAESKEATIKLAIKALLEVVQGKNLEVAKMEKGSKMALLSAEEIDKYVTIIEKEKEEEMEKKKAKKWWHVVSSGDMLDMFFIDYYKNCI